MSEKNKTFYISADDMEKGMHVVPIDNNGYPCNGLPFKITVIDFPFMMAEAVCKSIPVTTFDIRLFKFKRATEEYIEAHQEVERKYEERVKNNPVRSNSLGDIITGFITGEDKEVNGPMNPFDGEQNPNA